MCLPHLLVVLSHLRIRLGLFRENLCVKDAGSFILWHLNVRLLKGALSPAGGLGTAVCASGLPLCPAAL